MFFPAIATTRLALNHDDCQRNVARLGDAVSTTKWDRAVWGDSITHVANGCLPVALACDCDVNGNRASETLSDAGRTPITRTFRHNEADRFDCHRTGSKMDPRTRCITPVQDPHRIDWAWRRSSGHLSVRPTRPTHTLAIESP